MTAVAPSNSLSQLDRREALGGLLATMFAVAACSPTSTREDPATADGGSTSEDSTPPSSAPPTLSTTSVVVDTQTAAGTRDAELHALRRFSYGPRTDDLERVRALGITAWLDEQLAPDALDVGALEDRLAAIFPQLAQTAPELIADYEADNNGPQLFGVLAGAALIRHTTSAAQLHERIVEFWGDHFNAPQVTPPATIARLVMDREVLRPHAFGRFDELLIAVAQSPAMLLYLDNGRSSVGAINENYARELLELHTVGVGGGYSEGDIVEVARLLTGWGYTRQLEFRFTPSRHDEGPVSMLGWQRPTAGDPLDHGVDFLRHLAQMPETAKFVCRKLAVRFVADEPDEELVDAMAATWIRNNSEIAPVIRYMVDHPAFVDAPPKFNRPWDYFMQTLRSLDAEIEVIAPSDIRAAIGAARDLGQVPFRWPSPDGYPDTESFWLDAGALLSRWDLVTKLTDPARESLQTNVAEQVDGLRGKEADEVYLALTERLRFAPLDDDLRAVLTELTAWAPNHVPSDDELDEFAPSIAFMALAAPSTLYR